MKLYHGTSEVRAREAMRQGLLPRAAHQFSNWSHTVDSHPDAVYLTDAYPVYFATQACVEKSERLAVIEIDTDRLNPDDLVPDEDTLEQVNRKRDTLCETWTMQQRVQYYRDRLRDYAGTYAASLRAMGTCAHLGPIPPTAFCRIAFIDYLVARETVWMAINASITTANYRTIGGQHKAITSWVFGDPMPALSAIEQAICGDTVAMLSSLPRVGVEIEGV